jgi:5,6-dimethylbenzimidazole synthase
MSGAAAFPVDRREGVYDAVFGRRDVRRFRPDPIPDRVLARLLRAAHHAPSVGYLQPWSFVVVRDVEIRRRVRAHVERERIRAASDFRGERRRRYLSFKLEGILEAPLNLCITCDPDRAGPGVIGRHTIRKTDLYSTCCAVQNLWLAARAEGVGVGWVSILRLRRLREILGIPARVVPVAYLCLGYPERFAREPELQSAGWRRRLPLEDLVHGDLWGRRPGPGLARFLHGFDRGR